MDLEAAKQGEVVVLAPAGSINTQTAPKLEQKAAEFLNASERRFVVDFAKVDYISSAGLRVLLMMAKRLKGQGALALCGLSEDVRKVFAICGFERDFTIVRTRDEALGHVVSAAAAPPAPAAAPASHAAAAAPAAAPPPPAPEPPAVSALAQQATQALTAGLSPVPANGGGELPAAIVARVARALAV